MKRAALAALLFVAPMVASAAEMRQPMLVLMKPTANRYAVRSLATSFDPATADERDLHEFESIRGFSAWLTESEIAALKQSSSVAVVEPDQERHALTDTVTAGQQTTPWGVTAIDAPPVWTVTRGKSLSTGPAVHVAIIDTGIDYHHPELAAAFKGGYNFVGRNGDPIDDEGHGTHVAGTIAALNDSNGVVGIAPDVDVYSLKVLSSCGSGSTSNIIAAIDWVIAKKKEIGGNWVVNLSLGSDNSSVTEEAEFNAAADAGILVFAASGNGYAGADGLSYPAGYPSVVSVGSVDPTLKISSFSQRGDALALVAPGQEVLSTHTEGQVINDTAKFTARFAEGYDADGNPICLSNGPVTGKTVFAGTGLPSEYPTGSAGKIAIVLRGGTDPANTVDGTFSFFAKAKYARAAGAIGVIVVNIIDPATGQPRPIVRPGFTLKQVDVAKVVPLALVTIEDGAAIRASVGSSVTMAFNTLGSSDTYDVLQGTSMACPHAVGAAALVWAVSPNSTASNVSNALEKTAKDLGASGRDSVYGFGLVDAAAAAKMLNPAAFGSGAQPQPMPQTGRYAGRRGH